MRYRVLLRSVQRRLDPGETVEMVAFMWRRHRLMPLYALAAFVALVGIASAVGFETWISRVAIGMAAAAIAANATTDYRALAQTSRGIVFLRASKIRQYAVEFSERLEADVTITRTGGTMLANDWIIGSQQFTVAKSSEAAMSAIAVGSTAGRS